MRYKFSKNIYLFLAGSLTLGLSQAFMMLFLNFYLRALGLNPSLQGTVNAIPALTSALMSLPAVIISRKVDEAYTLKVGSLLGVLGTAIIALSTGPLIAVIGSVITGIGSAFMMVSNAPFMARETTEETRMLLFTIQMALMTGAGFLGNIIGGNIPSIYSNITGSGANSLPSLRAALTVAAIIQSLGFIALLFLKGKDNAIKREKNKNNSGFNSLKVQEKGKLFKLILPNIIVGAGAGATIPYINIFIEAKFHISYSSLGVLFGWTSLATAVTVLIQPWLVKKFGQIKTILIVQIMSLPFLFTLGFAPYLWLVIVAMFTRGALMNAGTPTYTANAMSRLTEQDRPMYSALNMIGWNTSWAICASLSGMVRDYFGSERILTAFNVLFIWTMLMYTLSIITMYIFLYLPIKREESKKLNKLDKKDIVNQNTSPEILEEIVNSDETNL